MLTLLHAIGLRPDLIYIDVDKTQSFLPLASSPMASPASLHWLLEPHMMPMDYLRPLGEVEIAGGLTLVPVTPQRVETFVACEHSLRERRVGPALKEHLERFGSALAATAIINDTAVGCVRARLFHEYDPSLETILVSFIGVSPSYRNRGIGSHMIGHLARLFLACPRLFSVAAEVATTNDPSLRAFAKNGFSPAGCSEGKVVLSTNRC
jgi:RimJ/RimL family protein N-acetyltransferase